MIYPGDKKVAVIIELLEQTGLFASDEISLMEGYLLEETDGKIPEQLCYRNMSQIGKEITQKIVALLKECTTKEEARLGDLLFAVGGTSMYALFPIYMFRYNYCDEVLALEPAKKVASYAACIAGDGYLLADVDIQRMMELAENHPAIIKEAMEYEADTPGGELILLAVYFLLKYPVVEIDAGAEIASADVNSMKRYEDLLINGLHKMYQSSLAESVMEEIEKAIREGRMDGRILGLAEGKANVAVDRRIQHVLGGAAFMNFSLSPRLKNVVKVCFAACTDEMLDIVQETDLRGDFKERGGRFDQIFDIDSMKLIHWAAKKKEKDILEEQFEHNRDTYMAYMDTKDVTDIFMLSIIREKDLIFYQERQNAEVSPRRLKVTEALVQMMDVQCQDIVRKYLLGDGELEALYAWEGRFGYLGTRWDGDHWVFMRQYQLEFGFDSFISRCEAILMVCRGFNWFQYLIYDHNEIREESVIRLFAAMDAEKLALRYQINGYADMVDELSLDRWRDPFVAASREVFRAYLKERREEMISAFQNAPISGKCLGLELLGEEAEQNKAIILGFGLESSKAVRKSLLDILYEKRNWEKEMLTFLASKKGAEREIAVQVLAKWDSEGYGLVLARALEKEKSKKVRTLLEAVL